MLFGYTHVAFFQANFLTNFEAFRIHTHGCFGYTHAYPKLVTFCGECWAGATFWRFVRNSDEHSGN